MVTSANPRNGVGNEKLELPDPTEMVAHNLVDCLKERGEVLGVQDPRI